LVRLWSQVDSGTAQRCKRQTVPRDHLSQGGSPVMTFSQPSDLELLRHTFPEWTFGALWTSAASGPDYRRLVAIRRPVILSAPHPDGLATQITAEQIAAALRGQDES